MNPTMAPAERAALLKELSSRKLPPLLQLPSHTMYVALRCGSRTDLLDWIWYSHEWALATDKPEDAAVWGEAHQQLQNPALDEVRIDRRAGLTHHHLMWVCEWVNEDESRRHTSSQCDACDARLVAMITAPGWKP